MCRVGLFKESKEHLPTIGSVNFPAPFSLRLKLGRVTIVALLLHSGILHTTITSQCLSSSHYAPSNYKPLFLHNASYANLRLTDLLLFPIGHNNIVTYVVLLSKKKQARN